MKDLTIPLSKVLPCLDIREAQMLHPVSGSTMEMREHKARLRFSFRTIFSIDMKLKLMAVVILRLHLQRLNLNGRAPKMKVLSL